MLIMKQTLLIFLLISTYSISQTKLYVHPDGDNYAKNTQTIALLPLNVQVKLRPKQLKDFTSEQIEEMEKNESLDIQKGMHTWFLTRKKRGELRFKAGFTGREPGVEASTARFVPDNAWTTATVHALQF